VGFPFHKLKIPIKTPFVLHVSNSKDNI
jgi:hypothetical protein